MKRDRAAPMARMAPMALTALMALMATVRGALSAGLSAKLSVDASTQAAAALGARLRWQLALAARSLGRPGQFALVVLLAVLALQRFYLVPAREALVEQRAEVRSGLAALPAARHPHGEAGAAAAQDRRDLPAASQLGSRLEQAFTLMAAHGFPAREAGYRLTVLAPDRLQRLAVELPLAGDYPALRRMLQALSREPGLMIEVLALQRRAVGEARISVRLRFSLLGVSE